MSQENPQTNKELLEILRNSILAEERTTWPPENLELYDAENTACFSVFIEDTLVRDPELISNAEKDEEGKRELREEYMMYRTDLELYIHNTFPRLYTEYIEAISQGDAVKAEECLRKCLSGDYKEEEDDVEE